MKGIQVGKTTVVVSDDNGNYKRMIPIEVIADPSTTIEYRTTLKSGEALPFSRLHSEFSSQLGGNVVSVSGLNVPTDQGTLYYRYNSDAEPGYGVASRDTYYRNPKSGQRDLEDVTFVAKPDYMGGQVVVKYMAFTSEGSTYNCSIVLEVIAESGTSAGISVNTKYNTPVQFDANEFDRVCKERTGSRLDYVIFAQPPTRQGTLYTNYSASGNYGSVVSTTAQYSLRSLDDIWFVPAPGYTGPVTVYYTGHSVGTPGSSYAGQITITVGEDTGVAIGGVSYETSKGGVVYLDDRDFDNYCQERLDDSHTLNHLRFNALPSASEAWPSAVCTTRRPPARRFALTTRISATTAGSCWISTRPSASSASSPCPGRARACSTTTTAPAPTPAAPRRPAPPTTTAPATPASTGWPLSPRRTLSVR